VTNAGGNAFVGIGQSTVEVKENMHKSEIWKAIAAITQT
jgi:hypothetical protein